MPKGVDVAHGNVTNEEQQPVATGHVGAMWAGGKGVSRGYVNLPELTAGRFKPDPFQNDGCMMFNTGDLVRWRNDGSLNILGRADDQVKIKVRTDFLILAWVLLMHG